MADEITNLEDLLARIESMARDRERVSLGMIIDAAGRRSFGPLLLLVGVIMVSPLSGVPGMPSTMGVLVLLTAAQLFLHRQSFWLPRWMLDRTVSHRSLDKALRWLWPPARFIDRGLRPRLGFLVRRAGLYGIALVCVLIAAGMPLMELVPFSATSAGAALAAFGLALIARDGLLALLAFAVTLGAAALVFYSLS